MTATLSKYNEFNEFINLYRLLIAKQEAKQINSKNETKNRADEFLLVRSIFSFV